MFRPAATNQATLRINQETIGGTGVFPQNADRTGGIAFGDPAVAREQEETVGMPGRALTGAEVAEIDRLRLAGDGRVLHRSRERWEPGVKDDQEGEQ